MRTSIELSDALLKRLRRVMARRNVTLRSLVEEGLRRVLDDDRISQNFELRDGRFRGEPGFAAGLSEADIAQAIRDANEPRSVQ